jgi:hypothetical protein
MNLVQLGKERIQKFGETVTVVFENEEYTNVRINEMGCRLAAGLKSLGIGRGLGSKVLGYWPGRSCRGVVIKFPRSFRLFSGYLENRGRDRSDYVPAR